MGMIKIIEGSIVSRLNQYAVVDGHPLWSSRFIIEDIDVCVEATKEFVQLDVDIVRTNTYQCSIEGLMRYLNCDRNKATSILKNSVNIAKRAINETIKTSEDIYINRSQGNANPCYVIDVHLAEPLAPHLAGLKKTVQMLEQQKVLPHTAGGKGKHTIITGSIGSYGAFLHDGSEYNCNYHNKVSEQFLMDWHRSRIESLVDGGVDMLSFETIPCTIEGSALLKLLKEYPNKKAWLSFSVKNDAQISSGEMFVDAVKKCWQTNPDQLVAIGVNCLSPALVAPLFSKLKQANINIPLVVYANSGEKYDTQLKQWVSGGNNIPIHKYVFEWLDLGVRYIGACCRTTVDDMKKIIEEVKKWEHRHQ